MDDLQRLNETLAERVAVLTTAADEQARELASSERALRDQGRLLRDSEALYQSLVENLPMYVLRKDAEGKFTYVNRLFCQLMGKPSHEMLGKTDLDLYPPELAAKYRADDQCVMESGRVLEMVEENRTPDGTRRIVEVLKAPVRDSAGNVTGTQTAFWDVTARERARQDLREMNLVLENAVEGICRIDLEGRSVSANRTYARMLGCDPQQVVGQPWLERIHADDRAGVSQAYRRMQLLMRAETEARVLRADNSEFYADLLMLRACDKRGECNGHFLFVKDISERKEAEARLLQSERLAAIGQMVAGVAHESRNALQQIQSCSQLLSWKLDSDAEAGALFRDLEKAQDRLHRLFNELRGYASPVVLQCRPCKLTDVLEEAWKAVAHLHQGRDAALHADASGADAECTADPFQIEQVFRNILENSLAACGDPVAIAVSFSEARIRAEAAVRVALCDNGPGLTPEQKENIFQAFYTTRAEGSGLGMAIAKHIVEAHGGRIEVGRSGPPGAEILITLPRGAP